MIFTRISFFSKAVHHPIQRLQLLPQITRHRLSGIITAVFSGYNTKGYTLYQGSANSDRVKSTFQGLTSPTRRPKLWSESVSLVVPPLVPCDLWDRHLHEVSHGMCIESLHQGPEIIELQFYSILLLEFSAALLRLNGCTKYILPQKNHPK